MTSSVAPPLPLIEVPLTQVPGEMSGNFIYRKQGSSSTQFQIGENFLFYL